MSEFIYVLENPSMPGVVKIGRTSRSVSERVAELSSHTGVPTEFVLVKEYVVADSVVAEEHIHERLDDCRVSGNREFFKLEASEAIQLIDSLLTISEQESQRDVEREDELVAAAIPEVLRLKTVRPRMLEEILRISYEEALFVIEVLKARGMLNERNEVSDSWRLIPGPRTLSGFPAAEPIHAQRELRPLRPITVASTPMIDGYRLPDLDLLNRPDLTVKSTETKDDYLANSRLTVQTLAQFGIKVFPGDISRGPTITRYELHPAAGVKLEKITALANKLAAALKAERLNVLAPIPGKSSVGIDVPNLVKTKVIMRDLLPSPEWMYSKARIPLALGKDVYGHPIIADLSLLPHLLIAGGTGSGKSVCINTIIASLLYKFGPDQLRFVMIDPRAVELPRYNALPHLVVPVVTDPQKAIIALRWVMNEMEKRYALFAMVDAPNIKGFNERPKDKPLPEYEPDAADSIVPEKLSYVVVIIDELADLMVALPDDFETAIVRITHLGRAAGIHCIIATRKATATGLTEAIKANVPARVAFRCDSRLEARAIIGEAGADRLLGKGDMFYFSPSGTQPARAQGTLISEQETERIVDFIARQGKPSYELEVNQRLQSTPNSMGSMSLDPESEVSDADEDLIQKCIEVIRSEKKASVSLLQRRLKLGYGRVSRLMDDLEDRGIVGPSKGAEPRDILLDLDGQGYDGGGQSMV